MGSKHIIGQARSTAEIKADVLAYTAHYGLSWVLQNLNVPKSEVLAILKANNQPPANKKQATVNQPSGIRKCLLVFELTQSSKCVARYTTEATITSSCCPSFLNATKAWAAKIVGASNLYLFTVGYKLYQP
jgi:hypothetical protein